MHILEKKIRDAAAAGRYAVIPFLTAGYPDEDAFWKSLADLDQAGADVIEIGVPFSDPVADGPVVEEASRQVLADGWTVARILEGLKMRREIFGAGEVYPVLYARIAVAPTLGGAAGNIVWPYLADNLGGFDAVFGGAMLLIAIVLACALAALRWKA